ncbi:neurofilament heavy polypeptide-like [Palaemon carinicauda]|uniref:neurofilament heavy polypeptide-like n=1 Tax=Palaemon carinicauda TaxID=392227 RepID=UPI0035B5E97C
MEHRKRTHIATVAPAREGQLFNQRWLTPTDGSSRLVSVYPGGSGALAELSANGAERQPVSSNSSLTGDFKPGSGGSPDSPNNPKKKRRTSNTPASVQGPPSTPPSHELVPPPLSGKIEFEEGSRDSSSAAQTSSETPSRPASSESPPSGSAGPSSVSRPQARQRSPEPTRSPARQRAPALSVPHTRPVHPRSPTRPRTPVQDMGKDSTSPRPRDPAHQLSPAQQRARSPARPCAHAPPLPEPTRERSPLRVAPIAPAQSSTRRLPARQRSPARQRFLTRQRSPALSDLLRVNDHQRLRGGGSLARTPAPQQPRKTPKQAPAAKKVVSKPQPFPAKDKRGAKLSQYKLNLVEELLPEPEASLALSFEDHPKCRSVFCNVRSKECRAHSHCSIPKGPLKYWDPQVCNVCKALVTEAFDDPKTTESRDAVRNERMSEVSEDTEKDLLAEGQEEKSTLTPETEEDEVESVSVSSVPAPEPVPSMSSAPPPDDMGKTLSTLMSMMERFQKQKKLGSVLIEDVDFWPSFDSYPDCFVCLKAEPVSKVETRAERGHSS